MESIQKTTVGRREFVSFPDLGSDLLEAKIDTGAYTTALHCNEIQVLDLGAEKILSFNIREPHDKDYAKGRVATSTFTEKIIKNSFGEKEKRFVIKARIKIGRKIIKTSISLTDRTGMRYPVLIGRKLLRKRFVVDVQELHLMKTKLAKSV